MYAVSGPEGLVLPCLSIRVGQPAVARGLLDQRRVDLKGQRQSQTAGRAPSRTGLQAVSLDDDVDPFIHNEVFELPGRTFGIAAQLLAPMYRRRGVPPAEPPHRH